MKVLHFINRNKKFHNFYINCQEKFFNGVNENHFFIIGPEKNGEIKVDYPNVHAICEEAQLKENSLINKLKAECDIIIVTGMFSVLRKNLLQIIDGVESKTYLQFWGNDYVDYLPISFAEFVRNTNKTNFKKNTKSFLRNFYSTSNKKQLEAVIGRCAGVIVLTDGEIEVIKKAFSNAKNYYSVPLSIRLEEVKDTAENVTDISANANAKGNKKRRVIIGNSATASNRHVAVFNMLRHLNLENAEIVCPLSYGDKEYAKEIKAYGVKCFGDNFHSLDELMPSDDYEKLLSTCDVGVFYFSRQQGLGNVGILLLKGKKVFIDKTSPVWNYFTEQGFKIFDANEIKDMNTEEFFRMDKAFSDQNLNATKNKAIHFREKWENFYSEVYKA